MSDTKPECFSTLKPAVSCIDCKWAVQCIEDYEKVYLKLEVRR